MSLFSMKILANMDRSRLNPYRLIVQTSSSGINYVLNGHEHLDQYRPCAISTEEMPFYSLYYSASLVNQNEIPMDYRVKELI